MVTGHQFGISVFVFRRHFAAKPVVTSHEISAFVSGYHSDIHKVRFPSPEILNFKKRARMLFLPHLSCLVLIVLLKRLFAGSLWISFLRRLFLRFGWVLLAPSSWSENPWQNQETLCVQSQHWDCVFRNWMGYEYLSCSVIWSCYWLHFAPICKTSRQSHFHLLMNYASIIKICRLALEVTLRLKKPNKSH